MRLGLASALAALAAASSLATPASAAPVAVAASATSDAGVVLAGGRRDCKPYNGPFGFYDNPFCNGGDFTDTDTGRTIWGWEGGRSYWGWETADDTPPPRRVKRRAY